MPWTAEQRQVARHARIASGSCYFCSAPALTGKRVCEQHLDHRKRGARTRGTPPEPGSEAILMLVDWLGEDKRDGRPWEVAWNRRLRQVLASVDKDERAFWRDVFRASHVRAGFKAAYLGEGKRIQLR